MLHIKQNDYRQRWPIAVKHKLVACPDINESKPLVLTDEPRIRELSFVFFIGWLFTGILNREKTLIRVAIVPCGPNGESSILVLSRQGTHLASPRPPSLELLAPDYFTCPLDRSGGAPLSDAQKHLCPVVNKLRYNLAHARSDGDVTGLKEPHRTTYCCDSRKAKLWEYLGETIQLEPDIYGSMVGGWAISLSIPFRLFEEYLTGVEPNSNDFGKLMEETPMWYAMEKSGVLLGFPHAILKYPIEFNEIDVLLYDSAGSFNHTKEEPACGWSTYLAPHSLCLMEFTIGHHSEVAKGDSTQEGVGGRSGKDVPKNKLMNFFAFKSYGFRCVHAHYFTVTGESHLSPTTKQTIMFTNGFNYLCLSDECGENIEKAILYFFDSPIPFAKLRSWHDKLIDQVTSAAETFRTAIATA